MRAPSPERPRAARCLRARARSTGSAPRMSGRGDHRVDDRQRQRIRRGRVDRDELVRRDLALRRPGRQREHGVAVVERVRGVDRPRQARLRGLRHPGRLRRIEDRVRHDRRDRRVAGGEDRLPGRAVQREGPLDPVRRCLRHREAHALQHPVRVQAARGGQHIAHGVRDDERRDEVPAAGAQAHGAQAPAQQAAPGECAGPAAHAAAHWGPAAQDSGVLAALLAGAAVRRESHLRARVAQGPVATAQVVDGGGRDDRHVGARQLRGGEAAPVCRQALLDAQRGRQAPRAAAGQDDRVRAGGVRAGRQHVRLVARGAAPGHIDAGDRAGRRQQDGCAGQPALRRRLRRAHPHAGHAHDGAARHQPAERLPERSGRTRRRGPHQSVRPSASCWTQASTSARVRGKPADRFSTPSGVTRTSSSMRTPIPRNSAGTS